MKRGVNKQELAKALSVAVRSVERWVQQGCPCTHGDGGLVFVVEEVSAWRARLAEQAGGADDEPTTAAAGSRANRLRAQTAKDLLSAKKCEHELRQETRLKGAGLDERIRAASTHKELFHLTREVAALIGAGDMLAARGTVLRQLLADARRALTLATPEEQKKAAVFLVTAQAREVAVRFDRLVNGWRRRWIEEALELHMAADQAELPEQQADDDGFPLAQRLGQLGLDLHAEPAGERPQYVPAPVVPAALPLGGAS